MCPVVVSPISGWQLGVDLTDSRDLPRDPEERFRNQKVDFAAHGGQFLGIPEELNLVTQPLLADQDDEFSLE